MTALHALLACLAVCIHAHSQATNIGAAARVLLDLQASDFDSEACIWPNSVNSSTGSSAPVGSFACTVPNCSDCQQPSLHTISGAPAVVVNATETYPGFDIPGSLTANFSDARFDGMYGGNAWSFESWVLDPLGYRGGQSANMLFRWAPTDTADCASAFVSLGDNQGALAKSAGGHWVR